MKICHQGISRSVQSARAIIVIVCGIFAITAGAGAQQSNFPPLPQLDHAIVIGWNDLGMHCMNFSYDSLCILPPFNNIQAQVIQRGAPPMLLDDGVALAYRFPENTTSSNKVNFWQYEDQLFGVDLPLDVGLTGHGLTGAMEWNGTVWETTGIPITPFTDSDPTHEQPYQLVEVTLAEEGQPANVYDVTSFVVPVSTEIHCDKCHHEDNMTPEDAILKEHEGEDLRNMKPVLCAECHASPALGTTGQPGLKTLSETIHGKHAEENIGDNCYDCHPGTQTQCLRDVMYLDGLGCVDCHGTLFQVANSIKNGRVPWVDEPKCASCHPAYPENAGKLYRASTGHGGVSCAACHGSPHAILPTVQPRDGIQATRLQGHGEGIRNCFVCHTEMPLGFGPHNIVTSWRIAEHLLERHLMGATMKSAADYNQSGGVDIGDMLIQINDGI